MQTQEILDYFLNGGLVSIFSDCDVKTTHVWLRRDSEGNLTYTFDEQYGELGGARVPFWALHNGLIPRQRIDHVLAFLKTFGLSENEAYQVVRAFDASTCETV